LETNKATDYIAWAAASVASPVAIKFILPIQEGFVVRSDFLELRLETAKDLFTRIQSFVVPRQQVFPAPETGDISTFLHSTIGAVTSREPRLESLETSQNEITRRLSFPWLLSEPIPRRRVAVVSEPSDVVATIRRWRGAYALGMDLVILSTGSWFSDDHELSYLREAFIPMDLSLPGLADRIVDIVRSYGRPFDGMVAGRSKWLEEVARAADRLGLPTAPESAFRNAGDKSLTRSLESDGWSLVVSSVDELGRNLPLAGTTYPVVVKPVSGSASQCVFKVHDEQGLLTAVKKAANFNDTRVLIEEYVHGPEFDINFVLLDGEVIFSEVSDDLPSYGDQLTANDFDNPNFGETTVIMPTILPIEATKVIEKKFHQTLLRHGFKNGVFHVEGRLRSSPAQEQSNGVPDERKDNVSVYLHEVNARPPGYHSSSSTMVTYGIDYWALQLLVATDDVDRIRALSHPFNGGAIGTAAVNNIPIAVDINTVKAVVSDIENIKDASMIPVDLKADPLIRVASNLQKLSQYLVQHRTTIYDGKSYGNSTSIWWWLTTYLVFDKDRSNVLPSTTDIASVYERAVKSLGR
jgi:hypothetical protein